MAIRSREVAQKLVELRNTTSGAIIRSVQDNLARLMRDDPWLSDPSSRFFRGRLSGVAGQA